MSPLFFINCLGSPLFRSSGLLARAILCCDLRPWPHTRLQCSNLVDEQPGRLPHYKNAYMHDGSVMYLSLLTYGWLLVFLILDVLSRLAHHLCLRLPVFPKLPCSFYRKLLAVGSRQTPQRQGCLIILQEPVYDSTKTIESSLITVDANVKVGADTLVIYTYYKNAFTVGAAGTRGCHGI